jgi:mRNA interferase YafQ
MRRVKQTAVFKRDLKRNAKSSYRKFLSENFVKIIEKLANDEPLEPGYKDHSLSGNWKEHRECHLKPDLLLIYKKPDDKTLRLARIGSHSELLGK